MPHIFKVVLILIFSRQVSAGTSCKDHHSVPGFALLGHVYKSFAADRLATCYMACTTQPACQSLNYDLADKTCEFNNDTKYYRAPYFEEKVTSVYAENPGSESPWRKLNTAKVCFGAKGNHFGKFVIEVGGSAKSVKLVYVFGSIHCNTWIYSVSKWGCHDGGIGTMLTTSSNTILLPNNRNGAWYTLSGYTHNSPEIVFTDLKDPLILSSGQELRIWYGEDWLNNGGEDDNSGVTCADVYAKYQ